MNIDEYIYIYIYILSAPKLLQQFKQLKGDIIKKRKLFVQKGFLNAFQFGIVASVIEIPVQTYLESPFTKFKMLAVVVFLIPLLYLPSFLSFYIEAGKQTRRPRK